MLHRKVLGHLADGLAPAEPRNEYVTQRTPQRQPFLHGGEPIAAARVDKKIKNREYSQAEGRHEQFGGLRGR